MTIKFCLKSSLKKLENNSDIDIEIWHDKIHYLEDEDYNEIESLNKLLFLNNLDDIISLKISNIDNLEILSLKSLSNIEKIELENIKEIIFDDFPESLIHLSVRYCALAYNPVVPKNVKYLDLSFNLIEELVNLSETITYLNLNDNYMKTIDNLPDSIEVLYLCNNHIVEINNLPKNLKKLDISHNFIESLPKLENINCTNHSNPIKFVET